MHLNLKANQLLPVAVFGMLSYLEPVLLFYCVDCVAGRAGTRRRIDRLRIDLVGIVRDDCQWPVGNEERKEIG